MNTWTLNLKGSLYNNYKPEVHALFLKTRKNPGQNHQSFFSIKFDPPPKKKVPFLRTPGLSENTQQKMNECLLKRDHSQRKLHLPSIKFHDLEDPKIWSPLKISFDPPQKNGSHFWFETPCNKKNSSIPSYSASSSPPFDRCVLVRPLGSSWRPPRPQASSSSSRHRWALRPQCLRWWVGSGLGDQLSHEKKSRGALLSIEQGEITLGKSHLFTRPFIGVITPFTFVAFQYTGWFNRNPYYGWL